MSSSATMQGEGEIPVVNTLYKKVIFFDKKIQ